MHSDAHLSPASLAFSLAAAEYDEHAIGNPIIQRLRSRAQSRMLHHWHAGDHILELNCGTGADALFLARHGIHVFATDGATGMIERTRTHVEEEHVEGLLHCEVMSFDEISQLNGKQFDGALSMFGGLNCADDLAAVAQQLAGLMRKDAMFIASFIGKFSIWEMLAFAVRGNIRRAFRRVSKKRIAVPVNGVAVPTRYWSVPQLRTLFSPYFEITRIEGWSALSPLPSSTKFYRKHPRLSTILFYLESQFSHRWPVNRLGDHVLLELRRT